MKNNEYIIHASKDGKVIKKTVDNIDKTFKEIHKYMEKGYSVQICTKEDEQLIDF